MGCASLERFAQVARPGDGLECFFVESKESTGVEDMYFHT